MAKLIINQTSEIIDESSQDFFVIITRNDTKSSETLNLISTTYLQNQNLNDFSMPKSVYFSPGQKDVKFKISIISDQIRETPESFLILFKDSANIMGSFSFTIIDDDIKSHPKSFSTGDDLVWSGVAVSPETNYLALNGGTGTDRVVVDFSEETTKIESSMAIFGDVLGPYGAPEKIVFFDDGPGSLILGIDSVEKLNIIGSSYSDLITCWPSTNYIFGGSGDDNIRMQPLNPLGDGNVIFIGGPGNDHIEFLAPYDNFKSIADGGSGFDRIDFSYGSTTQDLSINMRTGRVNSGWWTGFEQLYGTTGSGNDIIDASAHYIMSLDGGKGWDKLILNFLGFMADGRVIDHVYNHIFYFKDGTSSFSDIKNVEEVIFTGSSGNDEFNSDNPANFKKFNLEGGEGDDKLAGASMNDRLSGGAGADVLRGEAGNDIILGRTGNDTLIGGPGMDHLRGGPGSDVFVFESIGDSGITTSTRDQILDFSVKDGDTISLLAIDADNTVEGIQKFIYVGQSAFSHHPGELRVIQNMELTIISSDINGDGQADFSITLIGSIPISIDSFII